MTKDSRYGLFLFDEDTVWWQATKYHAYFNRGGGCTYEGILYAKQTWEEEEKEQTLGPLELVEWNND